MAVNKIVSIKFKDSSHIPLKKESSYTPLKIEFLVNPSWKQVVLAQRSKRITVVLVSGSFNNMINFSKVNSNTLIVYYIGKRYSKANVEAYKQYFNSHYGQHLWHGYN